MDIQHITLTAQRDSRLPLFSTPSAYREALHRLGAVCAGCLALFALVAEHLHLITPRSRAFAGRLAQAVQRTLSPVVATPFAESHIRGVESRSHMRWLVEYNLLQPVKHGMPGHPALWIGSCFHEIVGARRIDGLPLCIGDVLPSFSQDRALEIVGLSQQVVPASREMLRTAGAERLAAATAEAFALAPGLGGMTSAARRARRTVVAIADRVGIAAGEIARVLGIGSQSVRRIRQRPEDRDSMLVVARRISLEQQVQAIALERQVQTTTVHPS